MSFFISSDFLNHLVSNEALLGSFKTCTSNLERLKLLCHHLKEASGFEESLKEFAEAPVKDIHRSLEAKLAGVKEFGSKRLFPALLKTNESLSLAPKGCDFLPQLYGNRSAILFDLGKLDDCLVNINLALGLPLPALLNAKLLFRKAKCLKQMNEPLALQAFDESMQLLESLLTPEENEKELKQIADLKRKFQESWKDLTNNNYCLKNPNLQKTDQNCNISPEECGILKEDGFHFSLSKRNVQFPVASSQLSLSTSNQFGRGVFATEDIPPGEVVVLEEAAASFLCPGDQFRLNHCHFCLKRNPAVLIPCKDCDVLFCNEGCKIMSYDSSHKSECQILAKIKRLPLFGIVEMLALRFVVRDTLQGDTIEKLWKKISDVTHQEDYLCLAYHLETNEAIRDATDMISRAFKASILCHFLQIQGVFSETPSQSDQMVKFGSLLVHYFQVVACNAHDINAFFSTPQPPGGDQIQIGSALYPFCSMFNHSCDPNVVRHSLNGSSVVVTTLKTIRKGEQLFDNYGCHYATMGKLHRQNYLWEQYRFRCACQACQRDFPIFQPDREDPMVFIGAMTTADRHEILRSIETFNDLLAELVNSSNLPLKDASEKLSAVKRHMDLINRCVVQPHPEFERCQETYKRVLCYLTNRCVLEDGEVIPA